MFKKFREFRDRLTLKQATTISLIIPLLLSVLITCTIAVRYFEIQGFNLTSILTLSIVGLATFSTFSLLALFIFEVNYKQDCICSENAKAYVMANYNLSHEKYTELNYLLDEALMGAHTPEMLATLWEKADYTFYAKLTENEDVDLIVKDTNGNIIHNELISNFQYLKAYFEPVK